MSVSLQGDNDPRALYLGRSGNGRSPSRGSVDWPHVFRMSSGVRSSRAAPVGSLGTAWQSRENPGRAWTPSFSVTADANPMEGSRPIRDTGVLALGGVLGGTAGGSVGQVLQSQTLVGPFPSKAVTSIPVPGGGRVGISSSGCEEYLSLLVPFLLILGSLLSDFFFFFF